jgi:phenylalanine-4-hydroxylase
MKYRSDNFQRLKNYISDNDVHTDACRTSEDVDVWRHTLRNLEALWKPREARFFGEYLSGLDSLNISLARIPSLSEINRMLARIGWTAVYVDGMVDDRLYQEMQATQFFPVARRLRRIRDVDHSAAPDFIHDVIGHLPMLFSAQYRALVTEWAQRARDASPDATDREISIALADLINEREKDVLDHRAIQNKTLTLQQLHRRARSLPATRAARFARFYAWAIEFGISCDDISGIRVSGSASLSSPEELQRIFAGETKLLDFSAHALDTPVDYTVPQNVMYAVRDFSDYADGLRRI